jgi:hypothetical protein
MSKFQPGDFVMANNGKGACYMVNRVVEARSEGSGAFKYPAEDQYELDNGSVHVAKRALSGRHAVAKVDRYYKKVD